MLLGIESTVKFGTEGTSRLQGLTMGGTWMPSEARTTRPEAMSCGITRRTVSMPIAKPRPAEVPELVKMACPRAAARQPRTPAGFANAA